MGKNKKKKSWIEFAAVGQITIYTACFFSFCEKTIRFDAGKAEIFVIKVRGSPCGGKVNFKWPPFPGVNIPAAIFTDHGRRKFK
jgi:hypothetical protein